MYKGITEQNETLKTKEKREQTDGYNMKEKEEARGINHKPR